MILTEALRLKCSGRLRFEFPSAADAERAFVAIGKGGPEGKRCRVSAAISGNALEVEAEALDSVALRAVINTYLRNMKVIE
ncbi:MAG: KEOPS complex subunit Pcc1, partial [candidate division WOR-3 bacterium]